MVEPLPCKCGRQVVIGPQEGGGRGTPTVYCVSCVCGVREEFLGKDTGKKAVATREWNQLRRAVTVGGDSNG